MDTLRILIAEDHPLFRKGMVSLLSSVAEFEVAGEATTGEGAVTLAEKLQPDVVLMDLQMPEGNGIEATRKIVAQSPSIRVLVVTLFEDEDSVFMALRAGARSYVLKDADEEEMVQAIRAVGRGEAIFSPQVEVSLKVVDAGFFETRGVPSQQGNRKSRRANVGGKDTPCRTDYIRMKRAAHKGYWISTRSLVREPGG